MNFRQNKGVYLKLIETAGDFNPFITPASNTAMLAIISTIISSGLDYAPAILGLTGAAIAAIVARRRRNKWHGRASQK